MGGAAFALDGLKTPRMPSSIYRKALHDIEIKLAPLFRVVTHSIEAPEKADYGDIDVLAVSLPGKLPQVDKIADLIEAKKYQSAGVDNANMHFAAPWPATGKNEDVGEKYVQVDLTVCSSELDLRWRLFAHGHGDLVNILASTIRHKGLTLTSQALYLRVPGLETNNKKSTRIELSRSPEHVLNFLGLNPGDFWRPFATRRDLMTYIATCRFFDPAHLREQVLARREGLSAASSNSRDKSQLECRPLVRFWYDVFISSHACDAPGANAHITRADVEKEAFEFFGGDTRQRYEKVKLEVGTMLAREKLWVGVKEAITQNAPYLNATDLHDTLRAVRREVVASGKPDLKSPNLSEVQKAYLMCDCLFVHEWAVENHAAALRRWKELVARSRMPSSADEKKANRYSTSELETYTVKDDEVITRLKADGVGWGDILGVLGKKSKSQLQAHWKNDLQNNDLRCGN
jgi:predicted protein tyrosine phosphatase